MWKLERGQGAVSPLAMLEFLSRPRQKRVAQVREERLQLVRVERFDEDRFFLAADLEVNERDLELLQPELPAEQGAVHLCLRPVQRTMVRRHALELAPVGLDFLQQSFGLVSRRPDRGRAAACSRR